MYTLSLREDRVIKLLRGRQHKTDNAGITGFFRWASVMSVIWKEAESGNRWANAYLARNSFYIRRCANKFEELHLAHSHNEQMLVNIHSIVGVSDLPPFQTFDLKFANPYPYHVATLMSRFDELVTKLSQLWDTGIIPLSRFEKEQAIAGRHLRAIFHCVSDYRSGLNNDPKLCEGAMGPIKELNKGDVDPLYCPLSALPIRAIA